MEFGKINTKPQFVKALAIELATSLFFPLIVGILTSLATSGLNLHGQGKSILSAELLTGITTNEILVGVIFVLVTYLIVLMHRNEWFFAKDASQAQLLRKELGTLAPYAHFVNIHLSLPGKMGLLFSGMMEEIKKQGGGFTVLQVDDDHYLHYLTQALEYSEVSFSAILTLPYPPDWFFREPDPALPHELSSKQKLKYLEVVDNLSETRDLRARRIMIFEDDELKESFGKLNANERKRFFDLHTHVDMYWVSPRTLSQFSEYPQMRSFVEEDYALFDDVLVLKRNSKNQVTVCLGSHNSGYLEIFSDRFWSFHRNWFKDKTDVIDLVSKIPLPAHVA